MSAISTLSMAVVLPAAQAQTAQQIHFQIQPAPLLDAIVAFGQQSGLQVTYEHALVAGKQSPGVAGTMTATAALQQLLADAGVAFRFVNESTISLVRVPAGSALSTGSSNGLVLSTIEVTGVRETDPADVPYTSAGSAAYISGEQVERFRGTSVGDFLLGIPGVMNGDGRNSGAVDVNIRGMQGQGRVPVTIDGANNEVTVYRGYNGSTSRNYIDPDFIGSVEVEKGASSGADASGAIGGMVRMTTIGVKDILLPGKTFGIRLKGSINNNSSSIPSLGTTAGISSTTGANPDAVNRSSFWQPTGQSGSIAAAWTTEKFDVVASYAQRHNGNYYAGTKSNDSAHWVMTRNQSNSIVQTNGGLSDYRAGEEVLNTSTHNKSWLLKGTYKFSDEEKLELGYNRYTSEYGEVMPTQIWGGLPYQGRLNTVDLISVTTRYRYKPEGNKWLNLKVDAFYSNLDQRLNSGIRSGTNINDAKYYTGQKRIGGVISNTSRFEPTWGMLDWTYGAQYTHEMVGTPDGYTYTPADNGSLGVPRYGSRKEVGGFTSLDWKPLSWLTLSPSVRYTHAQTYDKMPGYGTVNGKAALVFKGPHETTQRGWSSVTSLILEPVKGYQAYFKYGNVVRLPSVFEALTSMSFVLPVTDNAVDPERNRSKELGFNVIKENVFSPNDKLKLHAAYFDNHIDNYITRTNVAMQLTPTFVYYTLGRVNLDYAEMKGFEVSAEYDAEKYFGGISWNRYTSTMFCAKAETKTDPTDSKCNIGGLANSFSLQQISPKDTITLNLGARFLEKALTVGTRVNYIGARMTEGMGDGKEDAYMLNQINASKWNPYTLVDLYASYKYSEALQFDMTIDNVTDRYYMDALNASLMPAPGRTMRASMTYKF